MATIYFDMDGTIADLYGVNNWLPMLIAEDTTPYEIAKPLIRMNTLARLLNSLKKKGFKIGIISWTSKSGSDNYNLKVADVKREWLKKHLASVQFDEINIVPYGFSKTKFCKDISDILFDDEIQNRENWNGIAHDVENIIETLKAL